MSAENFGKDKPSTGEAFSLYPAGGDPHFLSPAGRNALELQLAIVDFAQDTPQINGLITKIANALPRRSTLDKILRIPVTWEDPTPLAIFKSEAHFTTSQPRGVALPRVALSSYRLAVVDCISNQDLGKMRVDFDGNWITRIHVNFPMPSGTTVFWEGGIPSYRRFIHATEEKGARLEECLKAAWPDIDYEGKRATNGTKHIKGFALSCEDQLMVKAEVFQRDAPGTFQDWWEVSEVYDYYAGTNTFRRLGHKHEVTVDSFIELAKASLDLEPTIPLTL